MKMCHKCKEDIPYKTPWVAIQKGITYSSNNPRDPAFDRWAMGGRLIFHAKCFKEMAGEEFYKDLRGSDQYGN